MKTRVYVAGPLSKPDGGLQKNVDDGRVAGLALIRAGYSPMVPHLTCFMGGNDPELLPGGTVHEDWYSVDLPWVSVCQAVLRLPGESRGADMETGLAYKIGIPVYYSLADLLSFAPKETP